MQDDQNIIQQKRTEVLQLDQDIKRLLKKRKHGIELLVGLFFIMIVIAAVPILIQVTAKVPPTVFNEDGKFGIGTLTPSQFLDVRGHGNFSSNLYVDNQTLVNTWLYNQTSAVSGGTVTSVTRGEGFNLSGTSITTTGTLNINYTEAQRRVTGTCAAGSSIRIISETGTVTCETDDTTASSFSNAISNLTALVDVTKGINISGDADPNNNRTIFIRLNTSNTNLLTNESGSYSPIKFGYNMSDGNTGGVFGYNHTTEANRTMYLEYGKFWYNQSDNSQLLFNYNQSLSDAYNYSLASFNNYGIFWFNQSLASFNQYGTWWINQTINIANAYSQWWINQSITLTNAYSMFWFNQSLASQNQFGKFWYNMSDGVGGSSDNFLNVAFVNNSNLFTLPNNFTFNSGASIYAMNWSNVSIFTSQIRDYSNESIKYLQINASTYAGLTNESSKYLQLNSSSVIFLYNQSLSTATAIWNKSGGNVFLNNLGDKVGIGTTAPATTLHIANATQDIFAINASNGQVGIGTLGSSGIPLTINKSTSSATPSLLSLWNSQAVAPDIGGRLIFAGGVAGNGLATIGGYFNGTQTTEGAYMTFATRAPTSGALTEAMRITSTGYVGIGTTTPVSLLDVTTSSTALPYLSGINIIQSSTGDAVLNWRIGSTTYWTAGIDNSDSDTFKISDSSNDGDFDSTFAITTAGNVGIGTTSPGSLLSLESGGLVAFTGTSLGQMRFRATTASGYYSAIDFANTNEGSPTLPHARIAARSTGSGSYLHFGTSNAYGSGITNTAMTIDYLGNVGIGTTSPTHTLNVQGSINVTALGSAAATTVCWNGGLLSTCSSSSRYKENIVNITATPTIWNKYMQLQPVSFYFKNQSDKHLGLIAEDVEKIFPEYVFNFTRQVYNPITNITTFVNQIEGIDYNSLATANTMMIQNLRKENVALKNCILNSNTLAEIKICVSII